MAENRLCLKMVVGCSAAQRDSLCCPITDPSAAQLLVCFFVVLCVDIHNKVLEKLTVLKSDT